MHDPDTLILSIGPFSLWHHDPCKDGTDDSCGWFMRERHGDPKIRERIESRMRMDWSYWFSESGDQLMSTPGIVLQLFWIGAFEFFGVKNYKRAKRWMRDGLYDILQFSENPIDGLHDFVTQKYGPRTKDARIKDASFVIYGWLLRSTRPWWKHPRWHVHHWRISCRWIAQLRNRKNIAQSQCGQP